MQFPQPLPLVMKLYQNRFCVNFLINIDHELRLSADDLLAWFTGIAGAIALDGSNRVKYIVLRCIGIAYSYLCVH